MTRGSTLQRSEDGKIVTLSYNILDPGIETHYYTDRPENGFSWLSSTAG
jgi:hypothetical protein